MKLKFNELTLFFLMTAFLCGYIKNALIILFIVVFHELGHVLICKILGYDIICIEIFPFGGVTKISKHLNDHIYRDFLIAIFGVIFQLLLFIPVIFGFITNEVFIKYNLSIMLFNLLPIIPLDGSKIVFEVFSRFFSYEKVLKIYPLVSLLFIIIYVAFNYQYQLNNYLIVTLFLFKTFEIFKNRRIIQQKFLLERCLYDIDYQRVENNEQNIKNYKKDVKYYYCNGCKIFDEKEHLQKICKLK